MLSESVGEHVGGRYPANLVAELFQPLPDIQEIESNTTFCRKGTVFPTEVIEGVAVGGETALGHHVTPVLVVAV